MENSESSSYKFNLKSVNILAESKHRTIEFEFLKKFTIDGMISTQRALITMGLLVAFIIIFGLLILGNPGQIPYIIVPALILLVSTGIILINYMISSRDKSMLSSVVTLLSSTFFERARRSGKQKGDLKTFGIKSFDEKTGLLHFEDEDQVGRLYRIEGHLSRSSLPSIANQAALIKAQYLVARPDTTQETLITSVTNINVREQLKTYNQYYDSASEKTPGDAWRRYMASMVYNYVSDDIDKQETTIIQCLLLKDLDEQALEKAEQEFFNAVGSGLLALAVPLTRAEDVIEYLAPLTMLSKQGQNVKPKKKGVRKGGTLQKRK